MVPIYDKCPHCGADLKVSVDKKRKKASIQYHFGKSSRKRNKKHVPQEEISPVRINHIISSYKHISWNENSAKITILGYGDRPAFSLDGIFKKHDGIFPDIKVQFHTNTPGGGYARLYFWVKDKRCVIPYATFINAKKVTLTMLSEYHRLLGKEYKLDYHQSGYGYLFKE